MSATAAQIAEVRRMVAEPTEDTYTDEIITTFIERYPLLDALGQEPYTWNFGTTPPSPTDNTAWVPTYDLNAAACAIWVEKAGSVSHLYTFSADGGQFVRSQMVQQYMANSRYYGSRRRLKTAQAQMWPPPSDTLDSVVNNINHGDLD